MPARKSMSRTRIALASPLRALAQYAGAIAVRSHPPLCRMSLSITSNGEATRVSRGQLRTCAVSRIVYF
jgi:hypothetical protein